MWPPAMRAISRSPLPLVVAGVLTDDPARAVAADDLALLAHRLDRRSYLHDPFRIEDQRRWLWRPPGRRYQSRTCAAGPGADARRQKTIARAIVLSGPGSDPGPILLVPGREDAGAVGRHGDGELEMRRQRPVLREHRPAVVAHPDPAP